MTLCILTPGNLLKITSDWTTSGIDAVQTRHADIPASRLNLKQQIFLKPIVRSLGVMLVWSCLIPIVRLKLKGRFPSGNDRFDRAGYGRRQVIKAQVPLCFECLAGEVLFPDDAADPQDTASSRPFCFHPRRSVTNNRRSYLRGQ